MEIDSLVLCFVLPPSLSTINVIFYTFMPLYKQKNTPKTPPFFPSLYGNATSLILYNEANFDLISKYILWLLFDSPWPFRILMTHLALPKAIMTHTPQRDQPH